jgi:hypothetical protein
MHKSLTLAMAAFSCSVIGLQVDQYRFGVSGQNLKFEAVQVANTKEELTEFLKLVDTRNYGNDKELCIGEIIGTIGGPNYRIVKISKTETRHINMSLKKIKIPVSANINIKKGDKIDSHDKYIWYSVKSVRRGKPGYKDLVLVQGTFYE